MGFSVPDSWLNLALSLPKAPRDDGQTQTDPTSRLCIRKTRKFCPHNETLKVPQQPPVAYMTWQAGREERDVTSRTKREDVEGPGVCSLHATGLLLVILSNALGGTF